MKYIIVFCEILNCFEDSDIVLKENNVLKLFDSCELVLFWIYLEWYCFDFINKYIQYLVGIVMTFFVYY